MTFNEKHPEAMDAEEYSYFLAYGEVNSYDESYSRKKFTPIHPYGNTHREDW